MPKHNLWIMSTLMVVLAGTFLFWGSGFDFDYIIPKRLLRLATIILGGICVALSSIIFQTLVNNRILTPAVMGYESVYLLWQVLLLFFLGTQNLTASIVNHNFLISIVLMLFYSWLIHYWLLSKNGRDVYVLLLLGIVLSMMMVTLTQFIQLRISPGEFAIFQGLSYASFNRSQSETLLYAALFIVAVLWFGKRHLNVLDVMLLGREQSMSLGVDHHYYLKIFLALIAILVAVSTSLIGPTAFMGIFIANMAYALAKTTQHKITLPMGCCIAITVFLLAQILVEHVFNYKTTVSILINLVCGIYFLVLMMRTRGVA